MTRPAYLPVAAVPHDDPRTSYPAGNQPRPRALLAIAAGDMLDRSAVRSLISMARFTPAT